MKSKTLKGTVTNILLKKVTEEQAKQFALDNYGELCAYIRAEAFKNIHQHRQAVYSPCIGEYREPNLLKLRNKD
jgi:hypothetical protein